MSYKEPTQDEIHAAWVTTTEGLIRRIQKLETALERIAFINNLYTTTGSIAREALEGK